MTRAYNVIDADGHILEPLDLWDKYMDPEFFERRPRFVIDDNGKERLSVDGMLLPSTIEGTTLPVRAGARVRDAGTTGVRVWATS
jgi:uncharacterized protein